MKMFKDDIKEYPKFANYVKHRFTDLWEISKIRKAFKEYGQMNTWQLKNALRWGQLPYIEIRKMKKGKYGGYVHGYDSIRIATRVVEHFEAQNDEAFTTTVDGTKVYFAGVVLLHEMIHWGDFKKDGFTWVEERNRTRKNKLSIVDYEAGKLFEKAVYGHRPAFPHD